MDYTGGNFYIVLVENPSDRLDCQFVPQSMSRKRNANLSAVAVVGRSHPLYHYTGGSETIDFTLDFWADDSQKSSVRKKVEWLTSLGYGEQIKIVFGDMFSDFVFKVASVGITYNDFMSDYGFSALRAKVNLSLVLDPEKSILSIDIRKKNKIVPEPPKPEMQELPSVLDNLENSSIRNEPIVMNAFQITTSKNKLESIGKKVAEIKGKIEQTSQDVQDASEEILDNIEAVNDTITEVVETAQTPFNEVNDILNSLSNVTQALNNQIDQVIDTPTDISSQLSNISDSVNEVSESVPVI